MKKALTLALALAMCLGLAAPAFAEGTKTAEIREGFSLTGIVGEEMRSGSPVDILCYQVDSSATLIISGCGQTDEYGTAFKAMLHADLNEVEEFTGSGPSDWSWDQRNWVYGGLIATLEWRENGVYAFDQSLAGKTVVLSLGEEWESTDEGSSVPGSGETTVLLQFLSADPQPLPTEGSVDLSGNQYLKVSKNPVSWVHVVGDDGLGNDCDIVVLLLADDTTVTAAIPQGQEDKGSFSFWGVAEASGDGANQLESFSETAYSDGKYGYKFQDETLAYITERYASHLVSKGYQVDRISAEEAARLLAQADSAADTENTPSSGTAKAGNQDIEIDGTKVAFQTYMLADENGNGTNYVKLRDIAHVLNGTGAQFSVGYNRQEQSISATTGAAYQDTGTEMDTPFAGADKEYIQSRLTIVVDGQPVQLDAITLMDDAGNGYNYFKLRDLGEALGFAVGYSRDRGVYIQTR